MGVRIPIVLDNDVLDRVREKAREEAVPFRVKLNDLLRDGLAKSSGGKRAAVPWRTFSMGDSRLLFPVRVSELDALEQQEARRYK